MATKEEILQYIKAIAEQQAITKQELISAYDSGRAVTNDKDDLFSRKIGMAEILSYLGGAVVFIGIVILVAQNWEALGFIARIMITFGAGIAAYIAGVVFSKDERSEMISSVFHLLAALLMPIGIYVLLDQMGFDALTVAMQSSISAVLAGVYLISHLIFRKKIFLLFMIIFSTWFFLSFTTYLVGQSPIFDSFDFFNYQIFVVSIAYLLIGYSFSFSENISLSKFLYGFGILGFLGSALALGGWDPDQNIFWELIYPFLIFGSLYASVAIKNRSFLVWGTVFTMLYILKITSEYFSEGLGWPFALVLAGLAMMVAGYMSYSIKKKYLTI